MSLDQLGKYIHLYDITVVEESGSAGTAHFAAVSLEPPARWTATFDGAVRLANGNEGVTARFVRYGTTAREAVEAIVRVAKQNGWEVVGF